VEPKQTQILSPQEILSVRILHMDMQELISYLWDLAQENPTIELEEQDINKVLSLLEQGLDRHTIDRQAAQERENSFDRDDSWQSELFENVMDPRANFENDLQSYILWQLPDLRKPLDSAARYLISNLDSRGWLNSNLELLSLRSGFPVSELECALNVIQSLEPAGIGARNLQECLLLQLKRRKEDVSIAEKIVKEHLEAVARFQYSHIARALQTSEKNVREACRLIKSLNPNPASDFGDNYPANYIIPDVVIVNSDCPDRAEVVINDSMLPRLSISKYYQELMCESKDAEVREYLCNNIRKAKWVISAIERRRETLKACVEAILSIQKDFFCRNGCLSPLSMERVANMVGFHVSTVSRAVRGKYLQCARGVYPVSYFFSAGGLSDAVQDISKDYIKSLLRNFILTEDKSQPLSDHKLCELLAEKGIYIARRTVAKYREEMEIPNASGRRNSDVDSG